MGRKNNFKKYSKLKFNKPKFIVNEEKRTVTCILTGFFSLSDGVSVGAPKSFLGKNNPIDFSVFENMCFGNSYIIGSDARTKIIRTARCSNDDEFDVEKGKMIAKRKCKISMYNELSKMMTVMYMKLSHVFSMESARYTQALDREKEDYKRDYLS